LNRFNYALLQPHYFGIGGDPYRLSPARASTPIPPLPRSSFACFYPRRGYLFPLIYLLLHPNVTSPPVLRLAECSADRQAIKRRLPNPDLSFPTLSLSPLSSYPLSPFHLAHASRNPFSSTSILPLHSYLFPVFRLDPPVWASLLSPR